MAHDRGVGRSRRPPPLPGRRREPDRLDRRPRGIGGLAPANIPNYWGLTRITRAVVRFYVAVAGDSAVAPWLFSAMASTTATAADGFKQHFGLPSVAASWKVKQGWMCCLENLTRMHSTGLISGDRYSVALLIEGSPAASTPATPAPRR